MGGGHSIECYRDFFGENVKPASVFGVNAILGPRMLNSYHRFLRFAQPGTERKASLGSTGAYIEVFKNCFPDIEDRVRFLEAAMEAAPKDDGMTDQARELDQIWRSDCEILSRLREYMECVEMIELPELQFNEAESESAESVDDFLKRVCGPARRDWVDSCFMPPDLRFAVRSRHEKPLPFDDLDPQCITSNGDFVFMVGPNSKVYCVPLVNGCFQLDSVEAPIQGFESSMTASCCATNDGLWVSANIDVKLKLSDVLHGRIEMEERMEDTKRLWMSDGLISLGLNISQHKVVLCDLEKNEIADFVLKESRHYDLDESCETLLPDFDTSRVILETNGVYLMILICGEDHTLCRTFSLITGQHTGDVVIDLTNVVAATFDSINRCHWVVVREEGQLFLRQVMSVASVNPWIFVKDFTLDTSCSQAKSGIAQIMHYIGVNQIPSCYLYDPLELYQKIESNVNIRPMDRATQLVLFFINAKIALRKNPGDKDVYECVTRCFTGCSSPLSVMGLAVMLKEIIAVDPSQFWTNFYIHCLPTTTNTYQLVWAIRRFEMIQISLRYDSEATMKLIKAHFLAAKDSDDGIMSFVLSFQTGYAMRAASFLNEVPHSYLSVEGSDPEVCFARLCGQCIETGAKSLREVLASPDTRHGSVRPALLMVNNLIHLLPSFHNVLSVAMNVTRTLPQLMDILANVVAKGLEEGLDGEICGQLLKYTPYVMAMFTATAVQGGEFTEIEKRFAWLIRSRKSAPPRAFTATELDTARAALTDIYAKWRPEWHQRLSDDLLRIDAMSLSVLSRALHCWEQIEAIRTGSLGRNFSHRMKGVLDAILKVRHEARRRKQAGKDMRAIIRKLEFLFSRDFAAIDLDDLAREFTEFIRSDYSASCMERLINSQTRRMDFTSIGFGVIDQTKTAKTVQGISVIEWQTLSRIKDFAALQWICRTGPEDEQKINKFIERYITFPDDPTFEKKQQCGLLIFVFRLIRDCCSPPLCSRILDRMMADVGNDLVFCICCILACKADHLDIEERYLLSMGSYIRHLIVYAMFASNHKLSLQTSYDLYSRMASPVSRRIFSTVIAHQLRIGFDENIDLVSALFVEIGRHILQLTDVLRSSEWISIMRRAASTDGGRIITYIEDKMQGGTEEMKAFSLSICGGFTEPKKSYGIIETRLFKGVIMSNTHKACLIPVTDYPVIQELPDGMKYESLPDVAFQCQLLINPEKLVAMLQGVFEQASHLSFLAVNVLNVTGLNVPMKPRDWVDTIAPIDDESDLYDQLGPILSKETFSVEIEGFAAIQFASALYAIISVDTVEESELMISSHDKGMKVQVGVAYGRDLLLSLNRTTLMEIELGCEKQVVSFNMREIRHSSASMQLDTLEEKHRIVVVCPDVKSLDMTMTDNSTRHELVTHASPPPLVQASIQASLMSICETQMMRISENAKVQIKNALYDRWTRKLLTNVLLMNINDVTLDSAAWVRVYCVIAVSYEPFNEERLLKRKYPFEIDDTMRSSDVCSPSTIVDHIWRLEGFSDALLAHVSSMAHDPRCHLMLNSPLAMRMEDSVDRSVCRPADFYVVIASVLNGKGHNALINRRECRLPYVGLSTTGSIVVSSKEPVVVLPINTSTRDWISGTPFELLILLKHLYLRSNDHLILGRVKSIVVDSLSSPVMSMYMEEFFAIFTAKPSLISGTFIEEYREQLRPLYSMEYGRANHIMGFLESERQMASRDYASSVHAFFERSLEGDDCSVRIDVKDKLRASDEWSFVLSQSTEILMAQSLDYFPWSHALEFWLKATGYLKTRSTLVKLSEIRERFIHDMTILVNCWSQENVDQAMSLIAPLLVARESMDEDQVLQLIGTSDHVGKVVLLVLFRVNFIYRNFRNCFCPELLNRLNRFLLPDLQAMHIKDTITMESTRPLNLLIDRRPGGNVPVFTQFCGEIMKAPISARASLQSIPPWKVKFKGGEECIDVGGPSSELFYEIASSILSPDVGLFLERGDQFIPDPASEEWRAFEVVGMFIMICIRSGVSVPFALADFVWKMLCDRPVDEKDLVIADPSLGEVFRSLRKCQTGENELAQTWKTVDWFGNEKILRSGAPPLRRADIPCYIEAVTRYRFSQVAQAIERMKAGFMGNGDLTCESLQWISPRIVQKLVQGNPDISVDDLREVTIVNLGYNHTDWFWNIVTNMTSDQRVQLLKFATGLTRLPCTSDKREGFQITITEMPRRQDCTNYLPLLRASTCYKRITMEKYESEQEMLRGIEVSISCTTMENQ